MVPSFKLSVVKLEILSTCPVTLPVNSAGVNIEATPSVSKFPLLLQLPALYPPELISLTVAKSVSTLK